MCVRLRVERVRRRDMAQIARGDLYVEENEYIESGAATKVLSTSHLEGLHAQLKHVLASMVSTSVGLRLLDMFLLKVRAAMLLSPSSRRLIVLPSVGVQHNLKIGAKFGRNPDFASFDIGSLAKAAVVCRGVMPQSQQLEFVYNLVQKAKNARVSFRAASPDDVIMSSWEPLLASMSLDTTRLASHLAVYRAPVEDIRNLLLSATVQRKTLSRVGLSSILGSMRLARPQRL